MEEKIRYKRIFLDCHVFDVEFQGTQTYIREVFIRVIESNPHIDFYLGARNILRLRKIFDFSNVYFCRYRFSNAIMRYNLDIYSILIRKKIDLAFFQYIIPFIKPKKCQFFTTIHDVLFLDYPDDYSFQYRVIRKFLFKKSSYYSDFIATVSNYSAQRINFHFGRKLEDILLTPNGVSVDNKSVDKPYAIDYIKNNYGVKNYFIYVSRIDKRKKQFELVKFWEENDFESNLVFIGFDKSNKFAKSFKKNSIYHFQGISNNDLRYFLQASRGFCYVSSSEGFGIPPLEASLNEIPVLCCKDTAMSDFSFYSPYDFSYSSKDYTQVWYKFLKHYGNVDVLDVKKKVMERYDWEKSSSLINYILSK